MPASSPAGQRPTVFISYAHENEALRSSVKALADWLRNQGCNVLTDHAYQYRPPDVGWQVWMLDCIEKAETVLVVCTPKLKLRYEKNAPLDTGRGATYEGAIVTQHLYDNAMRNTKFFPILPDGDGRDVDIPTTLKAWWNGHRFPSGNEGILRMIFDGSLAVALSEAPPKERKAELQAKKLVKPQDLPNLAVFRDIDAPWCPEMVVLPAGEFLRGSPKTDKRAYDEERPQHRVAIGYRFAFGRYPVTFAEYARFIEATGRRHEEGALVWYGTDWKLDPRKSWRDPGFPQTPRSPVVAVNWHDAKAYVEWLLQVTAKPYRLPSEAEWEYACRAGTTTSYSFGEAITKKDANFGRNVGKTTEVGSYAANPWGLYDMHGNTWEWLEGVWHDNYEGAPANGSAWLEGGDPGWRVVRGGSWNSPPRYLRSANRSRGSAEERRSNRGFRLARTL